MDRFAWLFNLTAAVLAFAGLILLYWSLFHDRSRGRLRCPKCWYDMAGAAALACDLATRQPRIFRCPECGRVARTERRLRKTHRRWRWAFVSTVVLILAAATALTPSLSRDPWSVIPTPALVVILQFYDDEAEQVFQRVYGVLTTRGSTTAWERLLIARVCARKIRALRLAARVPPASSPPEDLADMNAGITPGFFPDGSEYFWTLERLEAEARPARPVLMECLSDAAFCIPAAEILIQIGAPARTIVAAIITTAERSRSAPERCSLLDALAHFGPAAGDASPALLRMLAQDPAPRVRAAAARALAHTTRPSDCTAALAASLADPDESVASSAADSLAYIGPAAEAAIEPLARAATDRARPLNAAGRALGDIGPAAVPALVRLLRNDRAAIRTIALQELAKIAPAYSAATAAVTAHLADPERITRRAAIDAVDQIVRDPDHHLRLFVSYLGTEPDPWLRSVAISRFDPRPVDESLPILIAALRDPDPSIRRQALDQFTSLGPSAAAAEPGLRALLTDESASTRESAAGALRAIGAAP